MTHVLGVGQHMLNHLQPSDLRLQGHGVGDGTSRTLALTIGLAGLLALVAYWRLVRPAARQEAERQALSE